MYIDIYIYNVKESLKILFQPGDLHEMSSLRVFSAHHSLQKAYASKMLASSRHSAQKAYASTMLAYA